MLDDMAAGSVIEESKEDDGKKTAASIIQVLMEIGKQKGFEVEVADPHAILDVIDHLPDKEYGNMADVEKSVGQVL